MAMNYTILVDAKVNSANIQAQLDDLTKKSGVVKTQSSLWKTLGGDIGDTTAKVIKFGAITSVINLAKDAVSRMIDVVIELDKAQTEYKKVSDLSGESLARFTEQATKAGIEVGRTGSEMISAATEFKKSGFSDTESLKLAEVSEMFRNIADAEIGSAEAASFIISQMKAFNMTASESEHIIDAVNETANKFAVGTDDLQAALTKASSSLSVLGNSYEESIGLVSSATEILVGQSGKVARGMRSIGINLSNLSQKSKALAVEYINASGATEKYSLALRDQDGNLRSTYDIMSSLNPIWKQMNDTQKTTTATMIAGKTQLDVFTASMNNFDVAINATEAALNSSDSAMIENARYMDSIEGKAAKLKSSFEVLAQKTIKSDFVKGVLEATTGILNFMTAIGGLGPTLTLVGSGFIMLKANAIASTAAMTALGISATAVRVGIGGVIGVLGLAVSSFNLYKTSQENARSAALDSLTAFENEAKTLSDVKQSIKEASNRQELIAAISGVSEAYGEELSNITDVNKMREHGIELIDEEAFKRAQETLRTTQLEFDKAESYFKKYKDQTASMYDPFQPIGAGARQVPKLVVSGTPEERLQQLDDWLEKTKSQTVDWRNTNATAIESVISSYSKLKAEIDENNNVLNKYKSAQDIVNNGLKENASNTSMFASIVEDAKTRYSEMSGAISVADSALSQFENTGKISSDTFLNTSGEIDEVTVSLLEEAGVLENVNGQWSISAEKLNALKENASGIDQILLNLSLGSIDSATAAQQLSEALGYTTQKTEEFRDEASAPIEVGGIRTQAYEEAEQKMSSLKTSSQETAISVESSNKQQSQSVENLSSAWQGGSASMQGAISGVTSSLSSASASQSAILGRQLSNLQSFVSQWNSTVANMKAPSASPSSRFEQGTPCYSNGTVSHGNNAVIDEHNKPEIVARNLGGRAVHLERGDAVLPNLASVNLMNFGSDPVGFMNSVMKSTPSYSTNANGGKSIEVGEINVSLPSVTDGNSFAKEITQIFGSLSKQYGSSRG